MDMTKRHDELSPEQVQLGNRAWWTRNPMAYDWKKQVEFEQFSPEWFDAIDERFVYGLRLFATENQPFDRIIPFANLAGSRVLEIGCGMGLHTELMARAGANVTAFDLSDTSIQATSRRLELKGLTATVMQGDAENLPFKAGDFDFVWSWGVIHHSSRTAKIVREIARVLTPQGECRVMVYNRLGESAKIAYFRDYLLKGGFLHRSFEETLYRSTDGFSARFYIPEHFEDLFRAYFQDVRSEICGLDSDAVPLPSRLRRIAMMLISEATLKRRQAKRGSFIFLTASNLC